MGYPTSAAVVYADKDRLVDLQKLVPCTQSINLSTNGTSYYAPTFAGVPKSAVLIAKNTTGSALLASCRCTVLSTNRVTFVHTTGGAKGSAYALTFYS